MKLDCRLAPETHKPGAKNPTGVPAENIALCAARRDCAAFEILLTGDCDFSLEVGSAPALSSLGAIPSIRLELVSRLAFRMNILAFHPDDDGTPTADALLECERTDVKAGAQAAAYAEIDIPADTEPGEYEVTVLAHESTMFSDERELARLSVTLTVYEYTLPERRDFDFHLDLWQHSSVLARVFGVPLWSERHFTLMEESVRLLAKLGQKAITLILSDAPWSGQWCHLNKRTDANLYEYSIVTVRRGSDGEFRFDFRAMQRYIDLCVKYGIAREITLFGLVNVWCDSENGFAPVAADGIDGVKIRYYDEADGCMRYMREQSQIDEYIRAIYEYFKSTGQLDRVRLMADEPADTDAYEKSLDHILGIAPGFVLKAALNHSEFIPRFGDRVSDFVPSLEAWSSEFDKITEYKATMPGKRFLWYVCNEPERPNTFLHSELCETLFIGVLTSMMGMDGFLRWSFTVWSDDPVTDNRYLTWPCGDLCLVYPSRSGSILETLRSKALGRAVALCELLNTLRKRFGDDVAREAYSMVSREQDVRRFFDGGKPIPAQRMYSSDYADYAALREYSLARLSGLQREGGATKKRPLDDAG